VGLVGPNDVKTLQTRVHDYVAGLQAAIDRLAAGGNPIPIDSSKYSIQQWGNLVGRATEFEQESTSPYNPMAYVYAGAAYERGRQLIIELDGWQEELARRNAPSLPPPVEVPHTDLGLTGGIGFALAAIVAILVLRELR
jgi:hypothetical protein